MILVGPIASYRVVMVAATMPSHTLTKHLCPPYWNKVTTSCNLQIELHNSINKNELLSSIKRTFIGGHISPTYPYLSIENICKFCPPPNEFIDDCITNMLCHPFSRFLHHSSIKIYPPVGGYNRLTNASCALHIAIKARLESVVEKVAYANDSIHIR